MSSFNITFKAAKSNFFDRASILDVLDKQERKYLARYGALVRSIARRSIKKQPYRVGSKNERDRRRDRRRRASKPGFPPGDVTGILKKTIFFSFDDSRRTVVIGPIKTSGTKGRNVPETLEYGRGRIRPRPFMVPAHNEALPQAENIYKETIR